MAAEKYQQLLDEMAIIAVDLDARGHVRWCNRRYLEVTGYAREDVIGQDWFVFGIPESIRATMRPVFEAFVTGPGPTAPFENEITTSRGETRMIRWHNVAFREGGVFSGTFSIGEDVTAMRALEASVVHTQKMDALGRLAGGVAHDFNNLLSIILTTTDIAVDEVGTGAIREQLEEIREAASRAAQLTRQLLTFSRRQVIRPEPLDLGDVVRGAEKLLRRLIGEDIELRVHIAQPAPCVLADRSSIEQVVINLALNARDAMPQGGVVDIAVDRGARTGIEGPCAIMRVRDTGHGMDDATRARIFEPFFTTKESSRGTGLGLANVLGIVEQAGGHVEVTSAPGRGSTFTVYLPSTDDVARTTERTTTPLVVHTDATILLVEDESGVRRTTQRILEARGYRVLPAADGDEALRVIDGGAAVDLVICDVVLGGRLDGRQTVEEIEQRRPGIAVLFVSGYAEDQLLRHRIEDLGLPFLAKPFTAQSLLAAAADALAR